MSKSQLDDLSISRSGVSDLQPSLLSLAHTSDGLNLQLDLYLCHLPGPIGFSVPSDYRAIQRQLYCKETWTMSYFRVQHIIKVNYRFDNSQHNYFYNYCENILRKKFPLFLKQLSLCFSFEYSDTVKMLWFLGQSPRVSIRNWCFRFEMSAISVRDIWVAWRPERSSVNCLSPILWALNGLTHL